LVANYMRGPGPSNIMILTNFEKQVLTGYPLTLDEAKAQGYLLEGECLPWMGYHYVKATPDGQVVYLLLLFNSKSELIGIEFESLTEPKNRLKGSSQPPWEDLKQGHLGLEFEHWILHIYWESPANAC